MLLVMTADKLLVSPNIEEENGGLWKSTWSIIDGYLPELRGELFPVNTEALASK